VREWRKNNAFVTVAFGGISDRTYPHAKSQGARTGQNVGEPQCCSEASVALRGTAYIPAMGILLPSLIALLNCGGTRCVAFRK
jgi:hypothetical protein